MKQVKQIFITITMAAVLLSFCLSPALAEKKQIHWQSYDAGIKMIKEQNKKGFLHFYTNWCTYCKLMNKQTFNDPKIIDYLNANFIPIKVNAEKEKKVAREYGVTRFPSNWFIAEDSSSLSNQPGFIPPEMFLNMLKFLNTNSFKSMKFSEFMQKQKKEREQNIPTTQ